MRSEIARPRRDHMETVEDVELKRELSRATTGTAATLSRRWRSRVR